MMDPTKDLVRLTLDSSNIRSEMQAISRLDEQFPLAQLKFEFQEIVLNPKHKLQTDYYKARISRSLSTSITDTTSNTLYSDAYTSLYTILSREDIDALRGIAEMLRFTDYLPDCAQIYIERRKDVVNLIWKRLHQKANVKDQAQGLNAKVHWWIQVSNIVLGHVFVQEKMFYEEIFGDVGAREGADDYVHIIGEFALNLFEFAGSLVASHQISQRLEMLLPLYQRALDLMPAVDLLFPKDSQLAGNIHGRAAGVLSQTAQQVKLVLCSSEGQVLHEASMVPTQGGKVHTMTEYVTRYLDLISTYRSSLTNLIATLEVSNGVSTSMGGDVVEKDLLSLHATRIIESLMHNLKNKSNLYNNESLGHLFMMNNVNHVAQRIKSSKGTQDIIEKDLQAKLSEKVEEAMSAFVRTSWNKVFQCLNTEKSKSLAFSRIFGMFSNPIKKKFKIFNRRFEDVLLTQAEWVVQDQKIREKLHQSILNKLIPAYTPFLEQYSCHIEKVRHLDRYIKYSVKDLEQRILNLFQCEELW